MHRRPGDGTGSRSRMRSEGARGSPTRAPSRRPWPIETAQGQARSPGRPHERHFLWRSRNEHPRHCGYGRMPNLLEVVSQQAGWRGRATKAEGKERVRSGISRFRGELATQPSGIGAGRSGRGVVKPLLMLGLAPPFPHIEQLPVTIYKAVHGELRTPCLSALHLDSCQV
jgi:hypothetical protein